MSGPSTSSGPGTRAKWGMEEGASKVASAPVPSTELPIAVVALKARPHEQETLGTAAPLVAEWRRLRTGCYVGSGRVERASIEERRWELEIEMIEEFGLTLPPETELLPRPRRDTHLEGRNEALDRARRERIRAQRLKGVHLWTVVALGAA